MTHPEIVSEKQWERWVQRGRSLIQTKTNAQFELGDITLEMIKRQQCDFEDHGVRAVLAAYADAIGVSAATLATYRHAAMAWPPDKRHPDVSFTIHNTLSAHPSRFRMINDPPVDPVSGERRWTVNEALRAAGRTPQHPVTPQERVDKVRDLVRDADDAALAVKDILRRPEVAQRVMDDPSARHILNQAARPSYPAAEHAAHPSGPAVGDGPQDITPPRPPAARVRYSEAPREALELIGANAAYYTLIHRKIPTLHVADYDESTRQALLDGTARVRAAADWLDTVIATGDTSMDEALAKLLGGES